MLTSLALIILIGLLFAKVCHLIKIPSFIGMIATGAILGPCVLDLLDDGILQISPDLRLFALILIILKAALALNVANLKKVGLYALLLSFIPSFCEIGAFGVLGPILLDCSLKEALLIGTIVAAVSPAIVIPRMVKLLEEHRGTNKSIPELLLAGASFDDIFVIVAFSVILNINVAGDFSATSLISMPFSLIVSITAGWIIGYLLSVIFEREYQKKRKVRNTLKVIIVIGITCLLASLEKYVKDTFLFSSLLAITALGIAIKIKLPAEVIDRISAKFGKLWIFAEIMLFVLLGAAINLDASIATSFSAVIMIIIGVIIRMIATSLCLVTSKLNYKEITYCAFSYIPKASVQAAIGGIPLAMGLVCGNMALTLAVVSIIITAPIGAWLMDLTYKKLLSDN